MGPFAFHLISLDELLYSIRSTNQV
jgi:hypothetical protein